MAISSTSSLNGSVVARLAGMREQMDALNRQLNTGKKADTFAALGRDRALSLSFRRQQADIAAYSDIIALVSTRLQGLAAAVDRIGSLGREAAGALDPNGFTLLADGTTAAQKNARNYLEELAALLNTDIGGRYMFSGKAVDTRPVESVSVILDGDGMRAGLRQVTAERRAADLGADGLGRLVLAPIVADTVSLSEEAAGLPFGLKLAGATSDLANLTVTGPTGAPPEVNIAFAGQPQPGQKISLTLGLPDGTRTTLALTAAAAAPGGPGQFAIGATPTDTADNLRAAIASGLQGIGSAELSVASGIAAANAFFASGPASQAMRVDGPPLDTATALRAATAADTVLWYRGDNSLADPRQDATARVDGSVTVSYGVRANEVPFATLMAGLAAVAVADFSAGTSADVARSSALLTRARVDLQASGDKAVPALQMEIAGAQRSAVQATERHKTASDQLETLLGDVEGIDINEVSVSLLTLQTRMQASYQATAMVYRMTLTDYL